MMYISLKLRGKFSGVTRGFLLNNGIWLSCLYDGMLKGNVLNNEVTEYESLAKLMALL